MRVYIGEATFNGEEAWKDGFQFYYGFTKRRT
jgi:hypothetical protein